MVDDSGYKYRWSLNKRRLITPCCQLRSMHMQGGGGGSLVLLNHLVIKLQSHFQLSDRLLIVSIIPDTVKWLIWACLSAVPIITIRCLLGVVIWKHGDSNLGAVELLNWPKILHQMHMHAALLMWALINSPFLYPPSCWLERVLFLGLAELPT